MTQSKRTAFSVKLRFVVVGGSALAWMVIFMVLALVNARVVSQVTVSLQPGVEEVRDVVPFGLGGDAALPDYKVVLSSGELLGDRDLGTKLNQSAVDGLVWPVSGDYHLSQLQEIFLIEDDAIKNDQLERVQYDAGTIHGESYVFDVETELRLRAGVNYIYFGLLGAVVVLLIGFMVYAYLAALV